eukprot:scaffold1594_cov401-Prasinococcus_capsulatus_cf.AAC.15
MPREPLNRARRPARSLASCSAEDEPRRSRKSVCDSHRQGAWAPETGQRKARANARLLYGNPCAPAVTARVEWSCISLHIVWLLFVSSFLVQMPPASFTLAPLDWNVIYWHVCTAAVASTYQYSLKASSQPGLTLRAYFINCWALSIHRLQASSAASIALRC